MIRILVISKAPSDSTYVVKDSSGREQLVYSNNKYSIGDTVLLMNNVIIKRVVKKPTPVYEV